jgi:hypothetical protein
MGKKRRPSGHYLFSGRPKVPRTREQAIEAAHELHASTGGTYAVYVCEEFPDHWHVGTARYRDLKAARRVVSREVDTWCEQGARVVNGLWAENQDILGTYYRRREQRRKTIVIRAIQARKRARKKRIEQWLTDRDEAAKVA